MFYLGLFHSGGRAEPTCLFPAQVDTGTDSGFRKLSANDIGYPPLVTSCFLDMIRTQFSVCLMETRQLCIMWRPVVGRQCWRCFCRKTAGWIPYVYTKELDLVKNSLLNIPESPGEGFLCVFLGSAEKQAPKLNGFVRDGPQLLERSFLFCPFSLNFIMI